MKLTGKKVRAMLAAERKDKLARERGYFLAWWSYVQRPGRRIAESGVERLEETGRTVTVFSPAFGRVRP